jgi:hypothetical protein
VLLLARKGVVVVKANAVAKLKTTETIGVKLLVSQVVVDLIFFVVRFGLRATGFEIFGACGSNRNRVSSIGPISEIDQAAAFRAKRSERILRRILGLLFTMRARDNCLWRRFWWRFRHD